MLTRLTSAVVLLAAFAAVACADDNRYFPANVHLVISCDMPAMLKSKTFQELAKTGPLAMQVFEESLTNYLGVAGADVVRMTLATSFADKKRPEEVSIVTTSKPMTAAGVRAGKKVFVWQINTKYEEFRVGEFTIHEQSFRVQFLPKDNPGPVERGDAFCVVEKNVVIYGRLPVLKRILGRKQIPELSPNLQAALKEAGVTNTVVLAADVQAMPESVHKDLAGMLTFVSAPEDVVARVQTLGLIANEKAEFQAEATLASSDVVGARKTVEAGLGTLKTKLADEAGLTADAKRRLQAVRKAVDAITLSAAGNKLTANVAVEPVAAARAIEMLITPLPARKKDAKKGENPQG